MQHSPGHQPRAHPPGHQPRPQKGQQDTPGLLSQSDPEPERPSRRPPIWLIVIVLLIAALIGMHIAGAH